MHRIMLLAMFLILILSVAVFAQEQAENTESEKIAQTQLFDEFPPVGECELGARIQYLFMKLGETSNSKGFIIVYRGADALPSRQTQSALERWIKAIKFRIMIMKLDSSRVEIVDGGFRKTSSIWNEIFIVPEGGLIPVPTDTVEKSKTPTDKAFKVDEGYLENSEALIKKPEQILEESETMDEEVSEMTVENTEPETSKIENSDEQSQEVDEEFSEENAPFWWFSDYFAESLKENKEAQGVIIFYTDLEEYDIAKSRQIIEEGLQNSADKSKANLSNVKIIFGGYRKEDRVEYWLVPKGAKEPQPMPEQKVKTEEINSLN